MPTKLIDDEQVEITEEDKRRHVINAVDAREQASEGRYSFMRSEFRRDRNGVVWEIPHKDLLDNDQQERWEELQHQMNKVYDREPDVLASDGQTVIVKGALVTPHCIDGKLVKPPWSQRLAIVLWGEDGAKNAKAGGVNFNEIEIIWAKQKLEMEERYNADPKSDAGGVNVAAAPNGN